MLWLLRDGKVTHRWAPRVFYTRGRLAIFHAIDLKPFEARRYAIRLEFEDLLAGRKVEKSADFKVVRATAKPS